ncbi:MAG: hypothetical protein MUP22_05560 [Desulfobacterales bacterium]|nr:hypothetical protein [Desulfobacterales bacterium]
MRKKDTKYRAILSSDWSECLSPTGPFDFISFIYPELEPDLKSVFKQYTGNQISLGDASKRIEDLLPSAITEAQMDAYLDASFATYNGVPELIKWCLNRDILFMINTTAMVGYFQRVFAKGLMPCIPVLSANPLVQYGRCVSDPETIYPLYEIKDKGKNSETAIRSLNIPSDKIILMGDSGGDGAHFEWGTKQGAFLIGSMTKASLSEYCEKKNIRINHRFGHSYAQGEVRDIDKEMEFDFMELTSVIEEILVK